MRALPCLGIAASFCFLPGAFSQTVDVNRQNRTIEVVVSETARVEPDIANITLGCVAYGQTHDEAYLANLEIATKVTKAVLGAGVPKAQIESSTVELSETIPDNIPDQSAVRKGRQFKAHQSWRIRLAASDAQKVIDIAVQAGANGIEDVSWDIAEPDALEEKARSEAMEKARTTAARLAKSAGAKLGYLLYASNVVSAIMGLMRGGSLGTTTAAIGNRGNSEPSFSLQVFPEKVEKRVTVRTVFALE